MALQCSPDTSIRSILFDCSNLAVVKGAEIQTSMNLSSFFHPIDLFFQTRLSLESEVITRISFGNIGSEYNEVTFVALRTMYPDDTSTDNKLLTWAWAAEEPDYSWNALGSMLVLSGSPVMGVKQIAIGNFQDFTVEIEMLFGR